MNNDWLIGIKKDADDIIKKIKEKPESPLTEEESEVLETYFLYEDERTV